jgi:hypothetical protein
MGRECGSMRCIKVLVWKPEEQKSLGTPGCRWDDNTGSVLWSQLITSIWDTFYRYRSEQM